MIGVIIGALVLGIAIVAVFFYGTRGDTNSPPALGTNNPFPSNFLGGADASSSDVIDEAEAFQRTSRIRRLMRRRRR